MLVTAKPGLSRITANEYGFGPMLWLTSPGGPFGKRAAGVGKIAQCFFNLNGHVLNAAEIGAEDFDPQHRAKAGGEHLVARLDRVEGMLSRLTGS